MIGNGGDADEADPVHDGGPRATPKDVDGVTELDISDDAEVIVDRSSPLSSETASRAPKPPATARTRKPVAPRVKTAATKHAPAESSTAAILLPVAPIATQAEIDVDLRPEPETEAEFAPPAEPAAEVVVVPTEPAPPEPLLVESIEAGELKVQNDLEAQQTVAGEEPVVPDASDLPAGELRAVIEAVLLVANRPLTIERLARCLPGTSGAYLEGFLTGLGARFDRERRGWELRPMANGWQLLTRREHHAWVRQLDRKELPTKLSKSALETLAIVAYQQPVTRGRVEDIRGVQCGPVLRQLMDMRLVAVTGRAEEVLGRPLLYGTTDLFLTRFGLGSLKDLPQKHELSA